MNRTQPSARAAAQPRSLLDSDLVQGAVPILGYFGSLFILTFAAAVAPWG